MSNIINNQNKLINSIFGVNVLQSSTATMQAPLEEVPLSPPEELKQNEYKFG